MEQGILSSFAAKSKLAAYHSVSVHGGLASADPHSLVQMLMDGCAERLATAAGCIERRDLVRKAKLLHSCVTIIAELRGCLNRAEGGPLAENLSNLYDYMVRQLLMANVKSDAGPVKEVLGLLNEIRGAWCAIGPQARSAAGVPQLPSGASFAAR
ncbi:MAG TPA: flagellar export chaperone FliS [Steroidobacteraceae bacterium]|jgi:flagellar protein FliS|nr:flagellar export chaperone FliS [Steroidobacteraceae bacterium]